MELQESGFIVATLFIALIALVLVIVARRDARIIREQAQEDAVRIREDLTSRNVELAQRAHGLDQREESLDSRLSKIIERENASLATQEAVRRESEHTQQELLRVAQLTAEEARQKVFEKLAFEEAEAVQRAVAQRVARAEKEAETAAQRVLIDSLARMSVATSSEFAIDVFELESQDLKGRIIGKEGRNIRTFEAVAGVNLLIEDSSLAVKVSSFDAERRDVAMTALSALMRGGIVTPARIELEVAAAKETLSVRSKEAGYKAIADVGITDIDPELVAVIGRMRFRTSYTQNLLEHSVETAYIAGILADEIGLDSALARRAGLLHDIGKVLTPAHKGSHANLGAKLATEHGESPAVINAIAAHHGQVSPTTLEAVLVKIADGISAARPGARNEDAASYAERMSRIESIVHAQPGVKSAFVLAAGHQVQIAVEADVIAESDLAQFSESLAQLLQSSVIIPGEIEMTVIREQRVHTTIG